MIARLLESSLVRFGLVAVAGLVVDLGTGWCLATYAGLPLTLAAFFGFCVGAAFNYLLHERWTFGSGTVSARRGSLYALALLATLATRVGTVAILEATVLTGPASRLPVLVLSTGVSFVVNYALSRFLVFRPASREDTLPG
jgi:putative flippase GtrA